MDWLPYIIAYAGLGVFVIAVMARTVMWSRLPLHVRWELYPVAHEGKRAHYGGSYLEDADWWKKPREASLWGEVKVMVPEILFLVALKEHNPRLWLRSFPFHFGLYLVIGSTVLMMLGGIAALAAPQAMVGTAGTVVHWAIMLSAYAGLVLSLLGALGLLQRRISDPALRDYSAPADLFNLLFFVVAFGFALFHLVAFDPTLVRSMTFAATLATFNPVSLGSDTAALVMSVSVVLMALLVAYIPLTHMSHFIAKYFAYHAVRWNDTPNLRDGPQEPAIQKVLAYPVSWSAEHIDGQGKKTWADVATEEMKK